MRKGANQSIAPSLPMAKRLQHRGVTEARDVYENPNNETLFSMYGIIFLGRFLLRQGNREKRSSSSLHRCCNFEIIIHYFVKNARNDDKI